MAALRFKLIAAMCSNGGIGYKGGLPWPHCKSDMAHFAQRTTGAGNNAVIMGRTTWDSIPMRPLKRRANLILSSHNGNNSSNNSSNNNSNNNSSNNSSSNNSSSNNSSSMEHWFSSMPDLFAHLESAKYDEVWIIGGARIYEQFLTMHETRKIIIDEMCITTMEPIYKCDTFFPLCGGTSGQSI
jgi:dihydrofolate reductase